MTATAATAVPRLNVKDVARRRRRKRQSRRLRTLGLAVRRIVVSARWISLAILLLAAYSLYQIGFDERFVLTRIPVDGVATIPPSEVVAASGLAGRHVFAVDPQESAAAVSAMPGVISATVTLTWPNNIAISIVEDSPIAVWNAEGESNWVNANGRIFPARGVEAPGLLQITSEFSTAVLTDTTTIVTTITGSAVAGIAGATSPPVNDEATGEAGETAAPAEQAGLQFVPRDVLDGALLLRRLRPDIDQLFYRPFGGLSFDDPRGWRVYVGVGTDMQQKLVVYEAVVAELLLRGQTPEYISVSKQEKPFYRVAGE